MTCPPATPSSSCASPAASLARSVSVFSVWTGLLQRGAHGGRDTRAGRSRRAAAAGRRRASTAASLTALRVARAAPAPRRPGRRGASSSAPTRASSSSLACCATASRPAVRRVRDLLRRAAPARRRAAAFSRCASVSSLVTASRASDTNAGASSRPAASSRSSRLNRPNSLGSAPARNDAGSNVPASNGDGALPLSPIAPSAREMPLHGQVGGDEPAGAVGARW